MKPLTAIVGIALCCTLTLPGLALGLVLCLLAGGMRS